MACACKTNQRLGYLRKNFGYEKKSDTNEELAFSITEFIRKGITFLVIILLSPMFLLNILINGIIKKKSLSIVKTFRLKTN